MDTKKRLELSIIFINEVGTCWWLHFFGGDNNYLIYDFIWFILKEKIYLVFYTCYDLSFLFLFGVEFWCDYDQTKNLYKINTIMKIS